MHYLIAKKIGMTRRFRDDGTVVPVTVLNAGPCTVTQVKTKDKDGYEAVQIGFGKTSRARKPQAKASGENGPFAIVAEFRTLAGGKVERGSVLDAGIFAIGEKVRVTGTSKGRGFQGVVKRHHFKGGPASHGHKDNLRMPGSIGATFPQHVMKGTRMAGHMGNERVSIKNLEVVDVVPDRHLLLVKGAVPGPRNGYLFIQSAA